MYSLRIISRSSGGRFWMASSKYCNVAGSILASSSSRAYIWLVEVIMPCGITKIPVSPIGLSLARAKLERKLSSLFRASDLTTYLLFSLRSPCITCSRTEPRPHIPDIEPAFAFLSSTDSCAACNKRRHTAFRSFLSGPASATRTCLSLETSRLGRYNSGLACFQLVCLSPFP